MDAVGELDPDLDTVVLLEAPAEVQRTHPDPNSNPDPNPNPNPRPRANPTQVQGTGLVSVEAGVAKVPLLCNRSSP